eukprot:TRINITY_DN95424_c0_g1_i1.p1 TRINITY_DN95424_c0_g1~~TRINITY_DN95424_c0_g1_i1.p1  ORF type:complete len:388 (+),score=35.92 TRINITY_DN95424_c0_g1_i1:23-1186(+)
MALATAALFLLLLAGGALEIAHMAQDPPRAVPDRYVLIVGLFGQLANQLVTISKAYTVAWETGRVLVLPRIYPTERFLGKGISFPEMFSLPKLALGPVPVVTFEHFALHSKTITPNSSTCLTKTCPCCKASSGRRCNCEAPEESKHQFINLLLESRSTFYQRRGNHLPCESPANFFRYLDPPDDAMRHVSLVLGRLGKDFLGVHLRKIKPTEEDNQYCLRKLAPQAWWYETYRNITWRPSGMECNMDPRLVRCFLEDGQPLFVGADRKNRTALRLLQEQLGATVFEPPEELSGLKHMLVDIFVLREAAVFLGNPLSSFSAVICAMRQSRTGSSACPNMPPPVFGRQHQCAVYPDNHNLYERFWSKNHPKLNNLELSRSYFRDPCDHN